jgi:translation elongation factor EF-Tu-like GTPase
MRIGGSGAACALTSRDARQEQASTGCAAAWCDDEPVASQGEQMFRMVIEVVVTLTGRPGVHLGGEIESGVVQVGDHLNLLDGGKLAGEVTCDGIGSLDGSQRCLVTVYCAALSAGEVREGQVLAGTQLRRPEDAAWPGSISAPLYQRLTAAATAFADRYAPYLVSQASDPQPLTDSDHEA